jgi:hypothetical protein
VIGAERWLVGTHRPASAGRRRGADHPGACSRTTPGPGIANPQCRQ